MRVFTNYQHSIHAATGEILSDLLNDGDHMPALFHANIIASPLAL